MNAKQQFLTELRSEISAAAEREHERLMRRQHRHKQMRAAALAAAIMVGVLGAVFVVSAPDAVAGVEIIRVGDDLIVRLTDLETRPEEVTDAVAEAGLDVTVSEVSVGVSNVGRFIAAESEGGYPPDLRVVDGDRSTAFLGFRIPADYDGTLRLLMGREARDGETWRVASDATARGEVLECASVTGERLGEIIDTIAADVDTQVMLLDQGAFLSPTDAVRESGDAVVVRAISPAPNTVWLEAAKDLERFPLSDVQGGC